MTTPSSRPRGGLLATALLSLLAALDPAPPAWAGDDHGVRFVDVTQQAGIDFRYVNGASGRKYMVEAIGSGAAFFDADGDGALDLYIVNGAALPGYEGPTGPNRLYRNRGDVTFADATAASGAGDEGYGMGAAVGDADADGDLDLYVANYGANVLYRNDADHPVRDLAARSFGFTDVTAQAAVGDTGWSTHADFVDVDGDGDLDLYVANYLAFDTDHNEDCRNGGVRVYCGPTTYPGESGRLYRNDGDGLVFTDVTAAAGLLTTAGRQLAAVFGDVDDDGDPDLFIANDRTPNFLFRNAGDGTFEEVGALAGVAYNEEGVAESAMGADVADVDNDGRYDIVVATFQWLPNTLYHNDGGASDAAVGFFTDVTFAAGLGVASVPFLGMTAAFLDYDDDGWLDFYVSNGHLDADVADFDPSTTYAQRNQLFHNDGDGTFTETTLHAGPGLLVERVSHGAVFGDIDDDGDTDIFVSDSASPQCTLLRNDGGNAGHWLRLVARGTASNRDGIGARVRAVAGDLVQTREIRRGYGYMGANDVRLLLGLGPRDHIDTLQVRWPSGRHQVLTGLAVDRTLVVTEPDTP